MYIHWKQDSKQYNIKIKVLNGFIDLDHFFFLRAYLTKHGLLAQLVKNPSAMWETWVQSLGWEDPWEKEKAAHSSLLASRIPWTIQSIGLQRVGHD